MTYSINDYLRREFEYQYEARITLSDKPYRRVRYLTIAESRQFMSDPLAIYPSEPQVEDVEMIEICLPREKLSDLLESQNSNLLRKEREERKLREEYPSLQSAWEQYQIVLAMVK